MQYKNHAGFRGTFSLFYFAWYKQATQITFKKGTTFNHSVTRVQSVTYYKNRCKLLQGRTIYVPQHTKIIYRHCVPFLNNTHLTYNIYLTKIVVTCLCRRIVHAFLHKLTVNAVNVYLYCRSQLGIGVLKVTILHITYIRLLFSRAENMGVIHIPL